MSMCNLIRQALPSQRLLMPCLASAARSSTASTSERASASATESSGDGASVDILSCDRAVLKVTSRDKRKSICASIAHSHHLSRCRAVIIACQ